MVEVEVVIATPQLKLSESTVSDSLQSCSVSVPRLGIIILVTLSGVFFISSLLARRVMYSMPWRMNGRDMSKDFVLYSPRLRLHM